jgi:1,4-dihydroxy-2-naphthoate polyprenyltransferase
LNSLSVDVISIFLVVTVKSTCRVQSSTEPTLLSTRFTLLLVPYQYQYQYWYLLYTPTFTLTVNTVTLEIMITRSSDDTVTVTRTQPQHKQRDDKEQRPPTWKVWVTATRPHTLTASICPCIVSFGYCYNTYILNYHRFQNESTASPVSLQETKSTIYSYFTLWIIFCMTVQIGTNLHNDYSDFVQGADKKETRVGQIRATAQGWLTPYDTCCAATIILSITLCAGITLIGISKQYTNLILWFLILSSVFNAFAYTAGPYPLGYIGLCKCSIAYYGLGDIFVFLYFGLVATYMVPYLLYLRQHDDTGTYASYPSKSIAWMEIVIYGIQVGLLSTNIIVVNNLRDRHTDVLANKRTTSVRFGKTFSLVQYCCNNFVSYGLVMVLYYTSPKASMIQLLPLLTIMFAYQETKAIFNKNGQDLNQHVGGTAKVQFFFCILLTIRLVLLP